MANNQGVDELVAALEKLSKSDGEQGLFWPSKETVAARNALFAQISTSNGVERLASEATPAAQPATPLREVLEALTKLKADHWEHWSWPDIHMADAAIAKLRAWTGETA